MQARRRQVTVALATGSLAIGGLGVFAGNATAADVVRDGSVSTRAAASCWAIKALNPSAPSKIYWLQTPGLVVPQKFYCDQVTDGGGWVLVGRGRDGWSFAHAGQGSADELRTIPAPVSSDSASFSKAFTPDALPTRVVDGLLNGASADTLTDGVRIRRASNIAGTSYQDIRWNVAPGQGTWSWAFGGGVKLSSISQDLDAEGPARPAVYNSTSSVQLKTRDHTGSGKNDHTRLWTFQDVLHKYRMGFSYGTTVAGATTASNPNSYLWQYTNEARALPFAQVWLRPRLMDTGAGAVTYTAPDSGGAPAQTLPALMSTRTSNTTPWGVTGVVCPSGQTCTGEQHIEVQALTQLGDTMYVGGKFQSVQQGAAGTKVAQSYVAGFDVNTGEWLSTFRPTLNGQVWDIAGLPDGRLVLAGDFTTVNGAASRGLVAVNPTTGAVDTTWKAAVNYTSTPTSTRGRALDVQGNWLYVGGSFTSVTGGVASPQTLSVGHATRLSVTDGRPDGTWKPIFNTSVFELDASDQGDRVYIVGRFAPDGGTVRIQANGLAVIDATTGKLVPGLKPYQPVTAVATAQFQQIVKEYGDKVWSGGSQHVLQRYSRAGFDLEKSNITRSGGDFQAMVQIDGVIYAACHCDRYTYSDAHQYLNTDPTVPSYSRVDPILLVGAWDAETGAYLPEFAISGLRSRAGNGPWELTKDTNGCMWFGGDLTQGSYLTTAYQWIGGFGKVCPRDTTAPTVPSSLRAVRTATGVDLTWGTSTDSGGAVSYELLKDDRVLITGTGGRYTDTGAAPGSTYWVRAIDAAGNRSATTAAVVG